MKKFFLLVMVGFIWAPFTKAQDVREGVSSMSQGAENCFTMEIPAIDAKSAAKLWKNFAKDFGGKTKYDSKSEEFFTDDASIRSLSDNTIDIYAQFKGSNKEANAIAVWFDLGGAYLSGDEHREKSFELRALLSEFYTAVEQELAEQALAQETKAYKKIEKEIKKLEKQNRKLEKNIEKAQDAILEAEQDIARNSRLKQQLELDLQRQKEAVNTARGLRRKN